MSLHVDTYTDFVFGLAELTVEPSQDDEISQAKTFLQDNPDWLKTFIHDETTIELNRQSMPMRLLNWTVSWIRWDRESCALHQCTTLIDDLAIRELCSVAQHRRITQLIPLEKRSQEVIDFIDQLLDGIHWDDHRKEALNQVVIAVSKTPTEDRLNILKRITPFVEEINPPFKRLIILSAVIQLLNKFERYERTSELCKYLTVLFKDCSNVQETQSIITTLDTQLFNQIPSQNWLMRSCLPLIFIEVIPHLNDLNDKSLIAPLLATTIKTRELLKNEDKTERSIESIILLFLSCIERPCTPNAFLDLSKNIINLLERVPLDSRVDVITKIILVVTANPLAIRYRMITFTSKVIAMCNPEKTNITNLIRNLCSFKRDHDNFLKTLELIPAEDRSGQCIHDLLTLIESNSDQQMDVPNQLLWIAPAYRSEAIAENTVPFSITHFFTDFHRWREASHSYLLNKLSNLTGSEQNIFAERIIENRDKLCLQSNTSLLQEARQVVERFRNLNIPVLEIHIAMSEVRTNPLSVLSMLSKSLINQGLEGLKVKFTDQNGIDAGGPSRQFVHELFSALVKTKYFIKEDDFYQPFFQTLNENLSEGDEKIYKNIGSVFMYCYYIQKYPIGVFFTDEMFTSILSFTPSELSLPFSAMSSDRLIEIQDNPDLKKRWQKGISKEQILETVKLKLSPLFAIAKGILHSKFHQRNLDDFSKIVQGELSIDAVLKILKFADNVPKTNADWVEEWIRNSSKAQLAKFVKGMTGSSSLSITIQQLTVNKITAYNPYFHSCGTQVDIPFDLCEDKKKFFDFFEWMLKDCENLNSG